MLSLVILDKTADRLCASEVTLASDSKEGSIFLPGCQGNVSAKNKQDLIFLTYIACCKLCLGFIHVNGEGASTGPKYLESLASSL